MQSLLNKKLLVCIAFHYAEHRIPYLKLVVEEFDNYKIPFTVIIDTNSEATENIEFLKKEHINVVVHSNLAHPFHLTSQHKFHILNYIDLYDWFLYIEDDMVLPYNNFFQFTKKFKDLWPKYIPGFIRVEQYNGPDSDKFSPDIMIEINNGMVVEVDNKKYVNMPYHYNYHAFWILPKEAIKDAIIEIGEQAFLEVTENRERSASFVIWVLNVPCLLSIDENGKLDSSCLSYHTPNNYPHSARRLDDIWKIYF